jgi:hypothetical protein
MTGAQIAFHVVGVLTVVSKYSRAAARAIQAEPDHDTEAQVPNLSGPHWSGRPGGSFNDLDVVGLEPARHPGLLQALDDRVVELLVGLALALEGEVLDLLFVEILPIAPHLSDVVEQGVFPGLRHLVLA